MVAPLPPNEAARLAALQQTGLLDSAVEAAYDDITRLASQICNTPIALVSLIDRDRQWFKSRIGLGASQTPRDQAFCAHTILQSDLFIVPDARADSRFAANPLVTGDPHIRFYAACPLATAEGHNLGTLCVIDRVGRSLTQDQKEALRALARQVMTQINMRRQMTELESYRRMLEEQNAVLQTLAVTDSLTGLKNRRGFRERLDLEFDRTSRYPGDLSLLLLDVDHFKQFNDAFGHPAGDEVLARVARLLESKARSTDLVARYGGEEFAILLPNTDEERAVLVAERMRRTLAEEPWSRRAVTVSIGISTRTPAHKTSALLIGEADEALYVAKKKGRNRVEHAVQLISEMTT